MTFTPEQRELRREHRARLDAARILVNLEDTSFRSMNADVPVLDWQVTSTGLVGRPPAFGPTPQERRDAFHGWAALLGAVPDPPIEHTYPTRTQVLRAETRVPHPKALTGDVRVVLYAAIDLEEEESEQ